MNSNVYGQPLPPKKDRRDMAREKARQQREVQQKRAKRNRLLWRGRIGVALIAAATVVALVIANQSPPSTAGPLNMASDGILLTGDGSTITPVSTAALAGGKDPVATDQSAYAGTANIVVYVDYLCPYCGQFETTNGAQIAGWVTDKTATLEQHPIAILDSSSAGSKYSTRAANAAACVANFDPDKFLAVNTALFEKQPAENTTGLSNAELVSLLTDTGVTDPAVATCITDQTFASWVGTATDRALKGPLPNSDVAAVTGTPTVLVNGVAYTGALDDAAAFEAFTLAQVG